MKSEGFLRDDKEKSPVSFAVVMLCRFRAWILEVGLWFFIDRNERVYLAKCRGTVEKKAIVACRISRCNVVMTGKKERKELSQSDLLL